MGPMGSHRAAPPPRFPSADFTPRADFAPPPPRGSLPPPHRCSSDLRAPHLTPLSPRLSIYTPPPQHAHPSLGHRCPSVPPPNPPTAAEPRGGVANRGAWPNRPCVRDGGVADGGGVTNGVEESIEGGASDGGRGQLGGTRVQWEAWSIKGGVAIGLYGERAWLARERGVACAGKGRGLI